MLPHTLHIGQQFSESSGFGIQLLHRLILLAFPMLTLRVVGLTEKTLLIHVIFLDLILFVGQLPNNLLLHNPP
jgi:hypothetical protein